MPQNAQIQLRRDTAANWTSVNPILALGEMGLETDTRKMKFGDGVTAWTGLSYVTASTTSIVGITGTLAQFNAAITDADIMPTVGGAFLGPITVPDDAYSGSWNGSLQVPTKNALYDKIESVVASIPAPPDLSGYATDAELAAGLANYVPLTEKGAANGVATLDGTSKVPAAQLPSYVDDVVEYANLAAFPVTGETGKIYVALDTGKTYRWTGSAYTEISSTAPAAWGTITGTLSNQTDLNTALAGKAPLVHTHVPADILTVPTGTVFYRKTAATGAAETQTLATLKTDLGLTGTNTGDQTTITGNAGTATALQNSRNFSISGAGVTAAAVAFNGTANVVLAASVDAGHVTLARMANLAANSIIGNNTAGAAVPLALSTAQTTAMLDTFTSALKGLAPASGGGTANFLRADGTWAAPPGGGLTDGDKGDVLVASSGASLTVQSAAGAFTTVGPMELTGEPDTGGEFYIHTAGAVATGIYADGVATDGTDAVMYFWADAGFKFTDFNVGTTTFAEIGPTGINIPTGSTYRINGVPIGSGGGALTDGDYGDVLVGGSGTTMTVQAVGGASIATVSQLANYLPLTGGTLTGALSIDDPAPQITLKGSNAPRISFRDATDTATLGQLSFSSTAAFLDAGANGLQIRDAAATTTYYTLTSGTLTANVNNATFGKNISAAANNILTFRHTNQVGGFTQLSFKSYATDGTNELVDGNITAVASGTFRINGRTLIQLQAAAATVATVNTTGVVVAAGYTLTVPDEAYGPTWNGSTAVPTKNAIYDKIETLSAGGGLTDGDKGDVVVSGGGATLTVQSAAGNFDAVGNINAGGHILAPFDKTVGGGTLTATSGTNPTSGSLNLFSADGSVNIDLTVTTSMGAFYNSTHKHAFAIASTPKLTVDTSLITAAVALAVPDDAYAAGWNGSTNVPTKNAVYDQMETRYLKAGGTLTGAVTVSYASPNITMNPVSGNATLDIRGTASTNDGLRIQGAPGGAYFSGDSLIFRNRAASVTYATIDSTGINIPTGATYKINGVAIGGGGGLTDGDKGDVVVSGGGTVMTVETIGGAAPALASQLTGYLPLTGGTVAGVVNITAPVTGENGLLTVSPTGGYIYSLLQLKGAGGSLAAGLNLQVGNATAYFGVDNFVFRNAASTTNYASLGATGLSVTSYGHTFGANAGPAADSTFNLRNTNYYGHLNFISTATDGSAEIVDAHIMSYRGSGMWLYGNPNIFFNAGTGGATQIATMNASGFNLVTGSLTVAGAPVAMTSQLANYLPLTGGEMTGALIAFNPLTVKASAGVNSNLYFTDEAGLKQGVVSWERTTDNFRLRRFAADGGTVEGELIISSSDISSSLPFSAPSGVFSGQVNVGDDPYAAGWNGSTNVPTKNAVYDKMQTMAPLASPALTGSPTIAGATPLRHASTSYTSAAVTLSTGAPSGGADGDIWLQYV